MIAALVEWWSSLVDAVAGLLYGYVPPEARALEAGISEISTDAAPELPHRLYHRERASGLEPQLEMFLDWWAAFGPFPLVVPALGGVRTDEATQAALYARGVTNARTLAETPHGRKGAVDLAPYTRQGALYAPDYSETPANLARYETLGRAAEAHGLRWGGRWSRPDRPHVEVPNWRSLPFPPR